MYLLREASPPSRSLGNTLFFCGRGNTSLAYLVMYRGVDVEKQYAAHASCIHVIDFYFSRYTHGAALVGALGVACPYCLHKVCRLRN